MRRTVIFLAFFLNGCAYIFQGTSQEITITTINDNSLNTVCVADNEEGIWKNIVPKQTVYIHRDGNEMNIMCGNEKQQGKTKVKPKFMANILMGDVLFDICTISCIVDAALNTLYEYPKAVSIRMESKM